MTDISLHAGVVDSPLRFPWEQAQAMGDVREVADGIYWLRMPLPFALDHINLYLLRHEHGWVVVDTGLATDAARAVWEQVFTGLFAGQPVLAVIATHCHYDHSGLIGWLVDRFQCPAYMTFGEYQSLTFQGSPSDAPHWTFMQLYRRAGMADSDIEQMIPAINKAFFSIDVPHSYRRLRDGQQLRIGDRYWRVVVGSGHSPEHACLYSEEDQLLISGDQVLPRITSSICITVTEPDANPLGEWLQSIRKLRQLPDSVLVLPAHERPFFGLHQRLAQLQQHHDRHLDRLLVALQEPLTAEQARALLFTRVRNGFDHLMAMGETLAHLNYLMEEGAVRRELRDSVWRYSLARADEQTVGSPGDIHV
ncbi:MULTISPECIES: MBL fold metallo-hydrolase [Halopseudomonas]|uniref:Glyoxylase, beta-lactamase superfamily II n=1 Tax=Halopseudomonas aestusnigri TaxID=857252 RepID=A0AAQ1G6A7_9GAMM|nr:MULTISPECIES: MBL fold metallo-hydrolase [Halopseudomonas]MDL2198050.1 MBL fold metallo-hydrolase [Halopseudomonas aestusnigri]OWL89200.1 Zn-dependent hydrolase [Halopseudomonas aestusnigri]BDX20138.1 MBL fold metallo-hydrolase [Halopseudomonas aestusnigri]SEG05003.1 Glyoxylase, beta-lactamase superfamily II [Halopseudomonas aestusnigri]